MSAGDVDVLGGPPLFVRLAADATRWQLLCELARSDLRVRELTDRVGQPQNAVSYHLAQLRDGGLVSMRQSSADRRESYYRLEPARCAALLSEAGAQLHPALGDGGQLWQGTRRRRGATPVRVLFLCTGNSGRSQLAEALLRHDAGARADVVSAGSHPKPLHPAAARVGHHYGVDISGASSKHLRVFARQRFDYVITLCDKVREVYPTFPGRPEELHWSIPDPAAAGDARAVHTAFRATAADLHERIGFLSARILRVA